MRIIKVMWGNSLDGSVSGLILAENGAGEKHWYLGSRMGAITEKSDIDYILKWGQKLPENIFTKKHEVDLL